MPQQKPYLLFAGQGGSAWGAYPAGALYEYLSQNRQAYDGGFGVSVNALNLAQLMATQDGTLPDAAKQWENIQQLKQFWWAVTSNDCIYEPWTPRGVITYGISKAPLPAMIKAAAVAFINKRPSLYTTAPLWKMIQEKLGGVRWHPSIHVGVVSLNTGRLEEISLGDQKTLKPLEAVRASAAIPVFFPAVNGYYDGGATDMTPLKKVFGQFKEQRRKHPDDPQELHVYRCSALPAPKPGEYKQLDKVVSRTLQILIDNADREDFERAIFVNKLAKLVNHVMDSNCPELKSKFQKLHNKYGNIRIYVIGPTRSEMKKFPADAKTFSQRYIREGFKLGQKRMQDFLKNKENYRLERIESGQHPCR